MKTLDWHRRSAMLAVFYLLALAYVAIYPLHFVRAYWDFVWPRFPILAQQLFPGTPWLLFVSVVVAILPTMMLAAAWLGVGPRGGHRFWLRALLLWLLVSGVLLGIVVVQLLFYEALLPRLDPRGLPLGVLLGLLLWLLLGRSLVTLVNGISAGLTRFAVLPASIWQLRWMVALLVWWLWLLGGRWAWPTAAGEAWLPGLGSWWWVISWLAVFGFGAAGIGGGIGVGSLPRLLLTWLGLSLVAVLCLLFGDWSQTERLMSNLDLRLAAQQAGILTGLLVALAMAVLSSTMATGQGGRLPSRVRQLLPLLAATLMVTLAMLPLDPELRLAELGRARLSLSVHALVQQFYQLIKDAMLWLPVGFIFTIGARLSLMWAWLGALCGALLLVLLPWLPAWPLGLLAGIGAAWAGLLSGVWLAHGSRPMNVGVVAAVADPDTAACAEVSASVVTPEVPVVPAVPTPPSEARSGQFRRREQSAGGAAEAQAKTAWRTREAGGEPADEGRTGGFRNRSALPAKPPLGDKDGG